MSRLGLPSLRHTAHLLLPGWCPELAALLKVLTLLQLLLPEVTAHHREAVRVLHSVVTSLSVPRSAREIKNPAIADGGECSVGRRIATTTPPAFTLRVLYGFQSEDFRLPDLVLLNATQSDSFFLRHCRISLCPSNKKPRLASETKCKIVQGIEG